MTQNEIGHALNEVLMGQRCSWWTVFCPTSGLHTGAGVAFVRRTDDALQCPGTLPKGIFDKLEGGEIPEGWEPYAGIEDIRVFGNANSAKFALLTALKKVK